MGLRDRLEKKAVRFGESALTAASEQVQRAGEGFYGLRGMLDDDEPLTIERFLLTLVRAVRDDGRADERSRRDVYVTARKRRRRLGLISFGAGPLIGVANHLADLYCETATVCDVAALHGLSVSDEQVAAHMLVLWSVTDSLDEAEKALGGEPAVASILGRRLFDHASERLPEKLTKRSAIKALWDVRETVGDARKGATTGAVGTVAFTGHRTKKVIKRAEMQLGIKELNGLATTH